MNNSTHSNEKTSKSTRIIVQQSLLSQYPHCILPSQSSANTAALMSVEKIRAQEEKMRKLRTVLSIMTWDGRNIMEMHSGE